MIREAGRWIKSLVYPGKCLACDEYLNQPHSKPGSLEDHFCGACRESGFSPIDPPYCTRCGIPFPKVHPDNHVCGNCLNFPLRIETIRAACEYKGIVRQAVPLFKYQGCLSLAGPFENLLFKTFISHFDPDSIDLIMPIPLHRTRLCERGFNQAFLLMRNFKQLYTVHFGRTPGWQIDLQNLVRHKATRPQTGFEIAQRKKNLRNAFHLSDPRVIFDKSILLVDDVATTGATLDEAARVLISNKARKVQALVLARA